MCYKPTCVASFVNVTVLTLVQRYFKMCIFPFFEGFKMHENSSILYKSPLSLNSIVHLFIHDKNGCNILGYKAIAVKRGLSRKLTKRGSSVCKNVIKVETFGIYKYSNAKGRDWLWSMHI